MSKTVTIFGSSLPKPGEQEYDDAYKLGGILAKAGLNVCTGGNLGIMDYYRLKNIQADTDMRENIAGGGMPGGKQDKP